MKILVEIPDQIVLNLLSNPDLSGDISKRLVQAAKAFPAPVEATQCGSREDALKYVLEKIKGYPDGYVFEVNTLIERFHLSDGDKRQIGKEIKAFAEELGFCFSWKKYNKVYYQKVAK